MARLFRRFGNHAPAHEASSFSKHEIHETNCRGTRDSYIKVVADRGPPRRPDVPAAITL